MLQHLCDSQLINQLFGADYGFNLSTTHNTTAGTSETGEGERISDGVTGSQHDPANYSPSSCSLYGVQLIFNLIFIYLCVLLLLYHKCWRRGKCSRARRHRPGVELSLSASSSSRRKSQKGTDRDSSGNTTTTPTNTHQNNYPRNNGARCSRTDSSGVPLQDKKRLDKLFQRRRVFKHHIAIWSLAILILVTVGADLSENVILLVHKHSSSTSDSIIKNRDSSSNSSIFHTNERVRRSHHNSGGDIIGHRVRRADRFISGAPSNLFENNDSYGTSKDIIASSSSSSDNHFPSYPVLPSASDTTRRSVLFLGQAGTLGGGDGAGSGSDESNSEFVYGKDAAAEKNWRRTRSSGSAADLGEEEHQQQQEQQRQYHQIHHEIIYEYLKIIGPLVTLTAVCVLLAFYHQFERLGESKYLLINVLFFTVSAVHFLTNVHLYWNHQALTLLHVKVACNVVCALASFSVVVLLVLTVIHEKKGAALSASSSTSSTSSGPKEQPQLQHQQWISKRGSTSIHSKSNIRYLHNYSTLPSRITFYWFTGLLRLGYRHPLEEEDLGDLPDEEKTSTQLKRFQNVYELERLTHPAQLFSLWKCMFKTLWQSLLVGGLFRLLADFTGFIAPLGIKGIVAYTEQNYTLSGNDNVVDDPRSGGGGGSGTTGLETGAGSLENLTISQLISNGYVMALIILLASFLQSTFSQCSTFLVNSEGIHIKFALQALIYKKSLTLSPTKSSQNAGTEEPDDDSRAAAKASKKSLPGLSENEDDDGDAEDDKESGTFSTGQSSSTTTSAHGFDNGSIVNIMSEDTNNIMMFFWMAHFIWAIPLKLAILMTLLYLQLGFSALIGAGVCILIMIPLQFLIGKKMSSNSKELMERCDERLRTISEILQGIKLLKLHGWELLFNQKVFFIREKELKNLDKDLFYRSIMTFLTHISSVLVTVVTFGVYPFIESEKLEPPKVFAGLALFNQLTVPLFIFPITVPVVIDALVSTRRVREFLLLPEAASLPEPKDTKNSGGAGYKNKGAENAPTIITTATSGNEGGRSSPPIIAQTPQNLMSIPIMSSKCANNSVVNSRNVDLQASSDSVFVLENIEEDEEEVHQDGNPGSPTTTTTSGNHIISCDGGDENSKDCVTSRLLPAAVNGQKDKTVKKGVVLVGVDQRNDSVAGDTVGDNSNNNKNVVWVINANFSWEEPAASTSSALSGLPGAYNPDSDRNPRNKLKHRQSGLSEISLHVPKEKLTVVVGPTGSGKSSLISALLGEMRRTSGGEMNWAPSTSIAYATQKPWMLNASVRENILFGKPFRAGRYKKVIQACALGPDIDILPENDLTEIGQKGINLSGGQKQRIATARALYSNANVVILDDPLSALDVEVAHHVLDAGIIKFLLRSRRTVILVTHHLPVLHHAYHIVAMERGRIRIQGTLTEIQSRDPACYKEWQEMISRKEEELNIQREARTAKERWTLLKLVSRVGLQFKNNRMAEKSGWKTADEETTAQLEPFRKRKGTFSHYKNLSHDIVLPSDEFHDEIMTPLFRRRAVSRTSRDSRTSASSSKHVQLQRMSSLQPETTSAGKNRSPSMGKKFKRLQSLPVEDDVSAYGTPNTVVSPSIGIVSPRRDPLGNSNSTNVYHDLPSPGPRTQDNLFKKLFSSKKNISSTGSSNTELEKIATVPAGASSPCSPRLASTVSGASEGDLTEDEVEDPEEALLARDSSQDEREYGKIPLRVYLSYIKACGKMVSGLYLYSAVGYEVVRVFTNFWLSQWSDTVNLYKDDQEKYDEIMSYYFSIYVVLSLATVIVSLSCNLLGKQAGANSREILHQRMMDRVVRCPVRFFESTPIGRIINRFSSDVAVVDRKLCISMQRFLQFVFLCFSAIVVNAVVNAWFLLLAIPIVAIYYYIQRFYRFSSRELQRIQAISRGPIYSHFHETLEGLSTIRAFREQKRFTKQMLTTLDSHNKADMFINVGNRWLSISLDYLGGVIVFLATLAAVISSHVYPDAVTASMVGLAINYTLLVPVYLNWVVKFLAEVEMFMNSVDRIDRYAELEIEDYEGKLSEDSLPKGWPTSGEVAFRDISVQYGPDRPAIISGLNVNVKPKEKVGICGRSGSGKSSLLMALFRISDVKNGQILIDGVNIHDIPLLKLRSSFSIIPQENIMFSGTLRFNLDPEGRIPDLDIWSALELCQLKETVQEMPGQLDSEIMYGGDSFSAGEKQLFALARAILHKSTVVIMDEATSSVDIATERTLLQVVKDVFKDSTVLTIAHRLDTIIDGDRVLVLEDGKLVEDGNPAILIKKPMSHFSTMVRNACDKNKA